MIREDRHHHRGYLYRYHVAYLLSSKALDRRDLDIEIEAWLTQNVVGVQPFKMTSGFRKDDPRLFDRTIYFRRYADAFNFCLRWQGLLAD